MPLRGYGIALTIVLAGASPAPLAAGAVQVTAPSGPATTQLSDRDLLLRAWLDVVALYRSGDAQAALRRLRSWPESQTARLEHTLRAGLQPATPKEAPAVVLRDAEASILLLLYAAHDAFASDADGRSYLKLAVNLARVLDEGNEGGVSGVVPPARVVTRADVYFIAGAIALAQWVLDLAWQLSQRALDDAPADTNVLLLAGSVEEALANALTRFIPSSRETPDRSWSRYIAVQRRGATARDYYTRALARDPALHEARIRRAWLSIADGQHEDARGELERAASSTRDASERYLACLFLGRLHSRARRFDEAAKHYRAAMAAVPRAQAAHLGLASVLDRQGDEQGAHRASEAVLELTSEGELSDDPWWMYLYGPIVRAAQHHQRLFELLTRP